MVLPAQRTVTGTYVNPVTGNPYDGTNGRNQYVIFEPDPSVWTDRDGNQLLLGSGRVNLDENGHFEKDLVVTDDPDVLPSGKLWVIHQHVGDFSSTKYISVPDGTTPLDITDLLSVEEGGITYVPVPGPTGPQGEQGPAGEQGPQPPLGDAGDGDDIALRSTDPTTTDSRTPLAHSASHATGGTDALAAVDIDAEPAGTASTAVTSHSSATDPHGDRAWADGKFALELDLTTLEGSVNTLSTSVTNLDVFVQDALTRVSAIEQGTAWLAKVNVAGGTVGLAGVSAEPTDLPGGGGVLFAEAGVLKWKGSSGTVTTIAPA